MVGRAVGKIVLNVPFYTIPAVLLSWIAKGVVYPYVNERLHVLQDEEDIWEKNFGLTFCFFGGDFRWNFYHENQKTF